MGDSADNFYIQFPTESTPGKRAVMLAAGFMLDYIYFEEKEDKNNNGGGVIMYDWLLIIILNVILKLVKKPKDFYIYNFYIIINYNIIKNNNNLKIL